MSELEKATLTPISSDKSARQLGDPVEVQFNPASLRLQLTNSTEGGETRGRQKRQYTGSSSTTLTLELIFDTADEGSTDSPRSVREKTAAVEQFIYPQGEGGKKQAPPKLRFQWGDLVLEGIVDSLTIDLDHFASNGVPLRAKVGFSFKEQDRRYEFLASGPGANRNAGAALPGGVSLGASASFGFSAGISAGIGLSAGIGISAQASVGVALGGESAAEFAARVGVDPEAWRGLSFEASAGGSVSLDAGMEVGFSAGLSASAGLGIQVGASAGASASLEASFGLEASASAGAGVAGGAQAVLQQGFALAAAGGVSSAIEAVKIANTQRAEQAAREAFAAPAGGGAVAVVSTAPRAPALATAAKPALPEQKRTPMRGSGAAKPPAPTAAPLPPKVDGRAASFGWGVPLRPVVSDGARGRSGVLSGSAAVRTAVVAGGVPTTSDPTTPPWVALGPAPASGGRAPASHSRGCSCGCGGGKR